MSHIPGTQLAEPGTIWVCTACGKRAMSRYGVDENGKNTALDSGWDESCMMHAALKTIEQAQRPAAQKVGAAPIEWEEPSKPVKFKLMYVNSTGAGGDVEDKHLRAAGYVPVAELNAARLDRDAANAELERFRSGLKCQDWVRTGWADAILFLEKNALRPFLLHTCEDEVRRRFMLNPDDPIRPGGASVPPSDVRTIRNAQSLIAAWVIEAFGPVIASNAGERVLRFVEEAVELAQACDAKPETLHRLVDYVYGRPKGTYEQEVAGSLVTLLAVASALGVDVESVFDVEQRRIHRPDIIEKVRNRQKEKREALVATPLAIKGE